MVAALYHPASGQVLDRGMVLRFPAPASFTGVQAQRWLAVSEQHWLFSQRWAFSMCWQGTCANACLPVATNSVPRR